MATRREFFQKLGFVTVGVSAGAVGVAAENKKEIDQKVISELEGDTTLMLRRTYGEVVPPQPNTYVIGKKYKEETRKDVDVRMTVGSDGNLYLKQNGKWSKVVTE